MIDNVKNYEDPKFLLCGIRTDLNDVIGFLEEFRTDENKLGIDALKTILRLTKKDLSQLEHVIGK